MRAPSPIGFAPEKDWGTKRVYIWIKKWGAAASNSGPVGYKNKKSYKFRRAMADMAKARKKR